MIGHHFESMKALQPAAAVLRQAGARAMGTSSKSPMRVRAPSCLLPGAVPVILRLRSCAPFALFLLWRSALGPEAAFVLREQLQQTAARTLV